RGRRRLLAFVLPAALIGALALAQAAFADQSAGDGTPAATPSTSQASTAPTDDSALGNKIASVALSQVGNGDNPVVTGFGGLNCNPYTTLVAGFSANSDGCGYDSTFNVRNSNE